MHIVQSLERLSLHLSLLPLGSESFSSLGTWCLVLHAHPILRASQPFVHCPPGCALPRHLLSKFGVSACGDRLGAAPGASKEELNRE